MLARKQRRERRLHMITARKTISATSSIVKSWDRAHTNELIAIMFQSMLRIWQISNGLKSGNKSRKTWPSSRKTVNWATSKSWTSKSNIKKCSLNKEPWPNLKNQSIKVMYRTISKANSALMPWFLAYSVNHPWGTSSKRRTLDPFLKTPKCPRKTRSIRLLVVAITTRAHLSATGNRNISDQSAKLPYQLQLILATPDWTLLPPDRTLIAEPATAIEDRHPP